METAMLMNTEKATLKKLREDKKLSVREVARRMRMTHQNIMRLESSGTGPITTIEAYADAVGVDFPTAYAASQWTRGIDPSPAPSSA